MIEIDTARRLGDFALDVRFAADSRGIVALYGRSGAGKTSLVNMMAGLLRPDRGRIAVDGEVLFDSSSGIDVAPERRRIGYVFQEDRLFPHMTVAANLQYGQRRAIPGERPVTLDQAVALLGIGHLLDRRPHNLSGGEKQRVAIGRALLSNPRLLLMDEPLASLDSARKNEILPFIERLRDESGLPIIYVSHMVEEIVRLADTLVLLSDGKVAAVGGVEALMSRLDLRPLTGRYEAGAVIAARLSGSDAAYDLTSLEFAGGTLMIPRLDAAPGSEIRVRIRARDVTLAMKRPEDVSTLNVFPGRVEEIGAEAESGGALIDVRLDIGVPLWARISRKSLVELGIAPGSEVFAMIKSVAIDRASIGLRGPSARDADG